MWLERPAGKFTSVIRLQTPARRNTEHTRPPAIDNAKPVTINLRQPAQRLDQGSSTKVKCRHTAP
jgi:hypothetical protein